MARIMMRIAKSEHEVKISEIHVGHSSIEHMDPKIEIQNNPYLNDIEDDENRQLVNSKMTKLSIWEDSSEKMIVTGNPIVNSVLISDEKDVKKSSETHENLDTMENFEIDSGILDELEEEMRGFESDKKTGSINTQEIVNMTMAYIANEKSRQSQTTNSDISRMKSSVKFPDKESTILEVEKRIEQIKKIKSLDSKEHSPAYKSILKNRNKKIYVHKTNESEDPDYKKNETKKKASSTSSGSSGSESDSSESSKTDKSSNSSKNPENNKNEAQIKDTVKKDTKNPSDTQDDKNMSKISLSKENKLENNETNITKKSGTTYLNFSTKSKKDQVSNRQVSNRENSKSTLVPNDSIIKAQIFESNIVTPVNHGPGTFTKSFKDVITNEEKTSSNQEIYYEKRKRDRNIKYVSDESNSEDIEEMLHNEQTIKESKYNPKNLKDSLHEEVTNDND